MKLKEVSTSDELKSWPHGILRFVKNTEAFSPVYRECVLTAFLKLSFPLTTFPILAEAQSQLIG